MSLLSPVNDKAHESALSLIQACKLQPQFATRQELDAFESLYTRLFNLFQNSLSKEQTSNEQNNSRT